MLLPATVAFLTGLALGSYLPYLPLSVLLILLLTGVGLTALERAHRLTVRLGLLVYGAMLAGLLSWTGAAWLHPAPSITEATGEEPATLVGTVVEPVRHAPGRLVVVIEVSRPPAGLGTVPAGGRIRLTWRDPDAVLGQGDRVAVTARLHRPASTVNPGGLDFESYLERRGITAVASVSGPGRVAVLPASGFSRWRLWRMVDGWRDRIREAALRALDGPALGIFLGIIIGEAGYVTPELRDRFMATGTVHILSISGSHLGLIAFLSFFCVSFLCRRLPATWLLALSRRLTATRLAALLTSAPVVLYTALAGAEVATVRSLVMIEVFLLAVWLGRANRLVLTLAVAALAILLHTPRALYDISFQLSFVSVLAIALVLQRRRADQDGGEPPGLSRGWSLRRWLQEYALVTGGVTLATAPLVAYYFNQIAWLGLVANLVVVPLVGFVLVPLGLGSALWLLLVGGDILPAGALLQRLLELLSSIVAWLAVLPGAQWHVASPAILTLLAFYVLLGLALRRSAPAAVRTACGLGAVLLLVWWVWSPRTGVDGDTLRITFLDVGQGDATVIELPDGRTVLIDGGASYETLDMGRAVVGPFLWDRGIRRLDHVIGTHPQLDHVGGLAWVLDTFQVGAYWGNGVGREEGFYLRLREALTRRGLAERVVHAGDRIVAGGACRLDVLNPPAETAATAPHAGTNGAASRRSGTELNNLSVVARLDCGSHSLLFPADLEREGLARMRTAGEALRAEVTKVPHHGARSSLDLDWVRAVGAEIAVISVGRRNPYGHPAPEVLTAYEGPGTRLYRTDRDGAVTVLARLSSASVTVHRARERLPKPVPITRSMWAVERENLHRLWDQWTGAV